MLCFCSKRGWTGKLKVQSSSTVRMLRVVDVIHYLIALMNLTAAHRCTCCDVCARKCQCGFCMTWLDAKSKTEDCINYQDVYSLWKLLQKSTSNQFQFSTSSVVERQGFRAMHNISTHPLPFLWESSWVPANFGKRFMGVAWEFIKRIKLL